MLFCDLVGSTELSERLDPEELRELMGRGHNAVDRAISGQGGYVAKLLDDGVLAYFGWPHAQEDAVERAIHAGMAANTSVAAIAEPGLHHLDAGDIKLPVFIASPDVQSVANARLACLSRSGNRILRPAEESNCQDELF